jgi:glycosyltransferase involved in cell wall biosynthesis
MSFHILSFEGPDGYAKAGGIASRITGLSETLAESGYETHLWFVGDPALPGHEAQGDLRLHRWCQWISRYHPGGVYAGEDGKAWDYGRSLPPYLVDHHLEPEILRGESAVILAEEWHTVEAVLHLDQLLRERGLRSRVAILWNANNTFGFDRIDWERLRSAAVITTVSRYMRQLMTPLGVDALVIPNGVSADVFTPPEREAVQAFSRRLRGRTILAKMARWDPDKRWLLAIDIVGALKREGVRPLLVARGGAEAHGTEVLARAAAAGLRVVDRQASAPGVPGLLDALDDLDGADIVNLRSPVDADGRRVLLRGADAVLANSSHEPFGLVGLETMAVGGLACTGCSGEDYAVPGKNALVLQTSDPGEFVALFSRLQGNPESARAIRRNGRVTARQYAWREVIQSSLLPRLDLVKMRGGTAT